MCVRHRKKEDCCVLLLRATDAFLRCVCCVCCVLCRFNRFVLNPIQNHGYEGKGKVGQTNILKGSFSRCAQKYTHSGRDAETEIR